MSLFHFRTAFMLAAIALALLVLALLWRNAPRAFRLVGAVTVLALPLEVLGYWSTLHRTNNAPAYNTFAWVEFLLLLLLVRDQRPRWRSAIGAVAIIGTLAMALAWYTAGTLQVMFIEAIVVCSFLLALLVGGVLWTMANTSAEPLYRVPQFWLFMGLLLYFAALPPVVMLARTVTNSTMATTLWTIMPVLCSLRYLLTAYATLRMHRALPAHG